MAPDGASAAVGPPPEFSGGRETAGYTGVAVALIRVRTLKGGLEAAPLGVCSKRRI